MEYLELLLVKPQVFPKSISNREDLPMETKLISIPLDQVLGMNLVGNSGWRLERAGIINKTDKQIVCGKHYMIDMNDIWDGDIYGT